MPGTKKKDESGRTDGQRRGRTDGGRNGRTDGGEIAVGAAAAAAAAFGGVSVSHSLGLPLEEAEGRSALEWRCSGVCQFQ